MISVLAKRVSSRMCSTEIMLYSSRSVTSIVIFDSNWFNSSGVMSVSSLATASVSEKMASSYYRVPVAVTNRKINLVS